MQFLFIVSLISLLGTACSSAPTFAEKTVSPRQGNWTVGQSVQTNSGPVQGHPAPLASDVSEYLGIPFAQPPIGDLRWAAPLPYNGTSTINGSNFGHSCLPVPAAGGTPNDTVIIQSGLTQAGIALSELSILPTGSYGEDCLTLNVWTKPQVGESKKAVLAWIYGGAFAGGSTAFPTYNGQFIADQEDVVVVSFNYRLDIFGFPGAPNTTPNLGLLDQRVAVEWIRDNIENFGGDPTRITLFGQSAGACSADYWTYAYQSDPIVHGVILDSGTAFSFAGGRDNASANAQWFQISNSLGCGDASTPPDQALDCMRGKSVKNILAALPPGPILLNGTLPWAPVVDNVTIFANYSSRLPAPLPVLLGSNDFEAGVFELAEELVGVSMTQAFWDDYTVQQFTCPTAERAAVASANHVPIWRYRYFGVFPNTALTKYTGAYHGSELYLVFGTAPTTVVNNTAAELSIASYMRGAWAAFAKDAVNGLAQYDGGWPMYNQTGQTLVRLAWNNQTGTNLATGNMYDWDCGASANASAATTGSSPASTSTSSSSAARPTGIGMAGSTLESAAGFTLVLAALLVF